MAGDEFLHGGYWHVTTCDGERQGQAGRDKWRRRRTDHPIPHPLRNERAASKIVKALFTDGNGTTAAHLFMADANKNRTGSGWGQSGAYGTILRILNGENE